MLRLAGWVFLGLSLTGCSAIGLGGSHHDPMDDEPPAPKAMAKKDPPAARPTARALSSKPASVEGRLASIEQNQDLLNKRTQEMASTIAEMRTEVEGLRTSIAMQPSSPGVAPLSAQRVSTPQAPNVDVEGRTAELLARLKKEGKRDSVVTGVAQELAALGPQGVARFVTAMRDRDFATAQAIESALEQTDPHVAVGPIKDGLRDGQVRIRCIRLLGAMHDDSMVPDLVGYLKDTNADVRFYAADALVKLEYKDGIPVLIDALSGNEDSKCAVAFQTLSAATGQSFGYRFYDSQEKREASAHLWSAWWQQEQKTFEFGHH